MIDAKWTLAITTFVLLSARVNGRTTYHQSVPSPGILTFRATSRADTCTHQGGQYLSDVLVHKLVKTEFKEQEVILRKAHIKVDKQQCGGVLLNPYFVLTAAHCVYQIKLRDISVVLGVYDIQDQSRQQEKPQTFEVVEKRIHPNFRFSAAHPDRYDVALLRLHAPVKYQKHISPICLPPRGWDFKGWRATITGWGKTDTSVVNRYGTRLLQKVKVPIIGNEECEYWHRSRGIDLKIYHEMTCAGYESGEKDACVGDSGGPMMIKIDGKWTLVGIISAGFGCAQSRQPGIYHRVSTTVDWIQSNLNG